MANNKDKDKDRSATRIQDDYVAGLFPHRDEYRPPEYVVYMERAAAALKTVRIVAYSGMVAFVILAAYGFFLIYQLTSDAHRMTVHMGTMSSTMTGMRGSMANMESSMLALDPMRQHMANMDVSTQHMANTVSLIQHSTRNLDRNISPMMGTMSSLPFMGGGNRGYQGAPPYSPLPPPLVMPYSAPRPAQAAGGVQPMYAQPWRAPQLPGQQPQGQQPQGQQPRGQQPRGQQPQATQQVPRPASQPGQKN
jgi:hypothetical protein